jgi:hypothetical protein
MSGSNQLFIVQTSLTDPQTTIVMGYLNCELNTISKINKYNHPTPDKFKNSIKNLSISQIMYRQKNLKGKILQTNNIRKMVIKKNHITQDK